MAFDFSVFGSSELDEQFVDWLVNDRAIEQILHYERLWGYYRNEMRELGMAGSYGGDVSESARPYCQAQEYGLPSRITGVNHSFFGGVASCTDANGCRRKEVVVENDIAWRVDAMTDFLFGGQVGITSRAQDRQRAQEIGEVLQTVLETNGGTSFFQELSLLGSVHGFVDVIVRLGDLFGRRGPNAGSGSGEFRLAGFAGAGSKPFADVLEISREIVLEAIEAPRSLPILDENNYRKMQFFIQHFWQLHNRLDDEDHIFETVGQSGRRTTQQKQTHSVEVIGPHHWQFYEDGELVAGGDNPLGMIPVVHIQNMPKPWHYEGQSDVEPLIPLQDELNTRLSDRANRITFQSFKMYLGKGIEGFEDRVVAPGRMWSTENCDAKIDEFGGDEGSPSEEQHIEHIREAIDKASGVASVAAGVLKGRVGNLTSAVALKVTLMGLLAKTERKRISYGNGIREISKLVLLALDKTGVYPNSPAEREVDVHWPNPLPENVMEKLQEALMKQQLGVPQEQILKELGYQNVTANGRVGSDE